jgi:glycosyltransferase involved in cell wall biosynthesis
MTKSIAIVHPEPLPLGGGGAVLIWAIDILARYYQVTLITNHEFNLEQYNRFFGTRIGSNQIDLFKLRLPGSPAARHMFMRVCKLIRRRFDLFFSTQDEMDFGTRGMQYIYWPRHYKETLRRSTGILRGLREELALFPGIRVRKLISGFDPSRVRSNLTVTVSEWTKINVEKVYGIKAEVLYPPVADVPSGIPFKEREDGFVCVNRIYPDKRLEHAVQIVKGLRGKGFDTHLHIIGPPGHPAYTRYIRALCSQNQDWAFYEGELPLARLYTMLGTHKWGLHTRADEEFGIVIVEMTKAGCIVFVPDRGGQTEIVKEPRFLYGSVGEAVEKISSLMQDKDLQVQCRDYLSGRASLFSVARYQRELLCFIERFFAHDG